ncbi:MAG: apolipoprotein N-acyltransferase [Rhodospirillaceae bacterium]|nr:MAG: apolipoprotein N-acyltransferase [Rhodospirillaceae bacterium]
MISAGLRWISTLRGWRRLAAAFCAGGLATAALPPFHVVPVLWIALPLLLVLLEGCASWRSAAVVGWAFGFGHFLSSLSWITNAFFVDADTFGVFAIPALLGLTFGMGVFMALVCAATQAIPPAPTEAMPDERATRIAARVLLFAAAWTFIEWVRSWILTGFPWNPMATVWAESATPIGIAVLQSTSVVGTFGLSLLTVATAAMPAVLGPAPRWRRAWLWAVAPLAVMALVGATGAARLAWTPTRFVPGVKVRLVQPNISEADKWRPELRDAHLQDYVDLSLQNRPADVTAVIWGESSVAYFMDRDEEHRRIAATAAPAQGVLIAGADRAQSTEAIFNSLFVIAPDGRIEAVYDKSHLVPFGEYMPLRWLIPFAALTGMGDFSTGPGLTTITIPGLPPFSPLICYEIIFPGHVTARGGTSPRWLLNLTNDSWFGTATGPYQHFATARLRAIEEGLPLVRSAGTGISAVVDSQGRVVASIGLGRRGVVDVALPEPAEFTIFGVLGNFVSLLAATATAWLAWRLYRRAS